MCLTTVSLLINKSFPFFLLFFLYFPYTISHMLDLADILLFLYFVKYQPKVRLDFMASHFIGGAVHHLL